MFENPSSKSAALSLLLLWIVVCGLLIAVSWGQIAAGMGGDPDDQLRLVQLRDWLAGQSWFDTTQYRIAAPTSQPMHWSRLVEIPLALVVVPLTPILGQLQAELAAQILVPLVTLGMAMALVFRLTERLFDRSTGLVAAALSATAVPLLVQLRPMRIDHHGWQIVLGLVALLALLDDRQRRSGMVIGGALALWLAISLEGLPMAAAFMGWLALSWLFKPDQAQRLAFAAGTMALGSALLLLLVHGRLSGLANVCDAVSTAHITAIAAGAGIVLLGTRLVSGALWQRAGVLLLAGAVSLGTLYALAPQCLGDAFGQIDPVVREYWFNNVREGLPIWQQPWRVSANIYGGAILTGVIGWFLSVRTVAEDSKRQDFFATGFVLLCAFLLSLFVQRSSSFAAAFALPFFAWAVLRFLTLARSQTNALFRILCTVAIIFLILPGPLLAGAWNAVTGYSDPEAPLAIAPGQIACDSPQSLARLGILPQSTILASFDLGPMILLTTPHSVVSSSHHRNDAAMADQIAIFSSSPDKARSMLAARGVGYIAVCPDEAELKNYLTRHPDGLWASLNASAPPPWAQPVRIKDSNLQVWRIFTN